MRIEPGTRALVTGASRGIGRAVAQALSARGAVVGLAARSEDELEALAVSLPSKAVVLPCDVGDREAVEGAVGRFVAEAGGLDLVVANAGIAYEEPFRTQELARAEAMTQVNWLGTLWTVHFALPHLLDQARGHVVVVSSGQALRTFPWAAVYGATKAAQKSFAEALRHELSGTGVGVTTVFPGEVSSDLHSDPSEPLPDWLRPEMAVTPEALATAILAGVEGDERAVYFPPQIRALRAVDGLSPKLADRVLRRVRGGTAAPRVD
jgi:short-subunit dehydrogenase